jgi:Family of unknown function (DUF6152)
MRTMARCAVVLVLGTAGVALAHHGWSGYDETKPMTLVGTIRASTYEQPHGTLKLDVEQPTLKTWLVVLAPPSRMESRGLTAKALAPGGSATVLCYPSKEKAGECRAERITIAGKTTELR